MQALQQRFLQQKLPKKCLLLYQAGDPDKIIGVFATKDHESSLAKMLIDNCTKDTCNKDVQYVDDVSSCEVEKEIVKLISYSKEEKINDFALKLNEKVVTVQGTLRTQEQANAVKLYLEYLSNKGHTVINKIQSDNLTPFVQEVKAGEEKEEKTKKQTEKTEDKNTTSTIEQSNIKIRDILSSNSITFEKERSAISQESKKSLDRVIDIISGLDNVMIEIAGYTDAKGGETYNKVLSQKRADAVRLYLIKSGVEEKIVKSVGYGEVNFIAEPEDSINRRVEIHLKRRKMK